MGLVVNTNETAIKAQRYVSNNKSQMDKIKEKLASGYKINKAADDAAGLMIAETLLSQTRGDRKALDNTLDGINMLNTADGALGSMQENLQRMRELAVQSSSDTLNADQRAALNEEFTQLKAEIDRTSDATNFNGVDLINNNTPANINIQIGSDASPNDSIDIGGAVATVNTTTLNLTTNAITNRSNSQDAISSIDNAMQTLGGRRANIGALTNRLEGVSNNLQVSIENTMAAESRIRDANIAKLSSDDVRTGILQQASLSLLAQANTIPSSALRLL